jgi:hypothetical protein
VFDSGTQSRLRNQLGNSKAQSSGDSVSFLRVTTVFNGRRKFGMTSNHSRHKQGFLGRVFANGKEITLSSPAKYSRGQMNANKPKLAENYKKMPVGV